MNLSSIKNRLILLVAVPLLALVMMAGVLLNQSYGTYQNSIKTHALMEVSVSAGNLIHTLQIERGATAGFLQSKGQKFADVLPQMRTQTSERLAAFTRQAAGIDTRSMPLLATAVSNARSELDKLEAIRKRASDLSLTVPEEVAYYTGTISRLIEAMSVGVELNRDAAISQQMIAYLGFVRAKENAGQERALVTAAFAADQVNPAQYRNILTKIHHQDAYLNVFNSIASEELRTSLASVMAGESAKEVARYRDLLISRAAEGGFAVDPTVWFQTITAKIDALHDTEDQITRKIMSAASSLQASGRNALIKFLVLALLALGLTVVVSFWVGRSISAPLNEMVRFTERSIAEDDFSGKVPEHGASEVVRTGRALNQLIDKFRKIILDAKQSSERITAAAHQLAAASKSVTENSLVQSDAAESVAAAVEQSSVSITETASNSQAAAQMVLHARKDSEHAGLVMKETVKKMDEVAKLIEESGESVHHLDESSQQIGNIVKVIKEIADQTNLLALNAAIEAARAGEQGRGFAVVADEVRKLAERTGQATGEISGLVQAIQGGIGDTVLSMQKANEHAASSLALVNDSANELTKIDEDDQEVSVNVQNISNALAEQDAAIRQIAVNVEQIAQMTESNNSASMENDRTAKELDDLARQLRDAVSVYKV